MIRAAGIEKEQLHRNGVPRKTSTIGAQRPAQRRNVQPPEQRDGEPEDQPSAPPALQHKIVTPKPLMSDGA